MRDEGLLLSALAKPQQIFNYETDDIHRLGAAYCFAIVKNHPFVDGNKRTGFLAMFTFLYVNGFYLGVDEMEAAEKIENLAAGETSEAELAEWLRGNTVTSISD